MVSVADRWHQFYTELEQICEEEGRGLPKVIAVSKTRSVDEVQEAIDVGITDFGENHPLEFKRKSEAFPDMDWHFIGHLQRNNVGDVSPTATLIHTLDRKKLARRLSYFNYNGPCFIQVNITGEASKSGTTYSESVISELRDYAAGQGLKVEGLMSIGSVSWGDYRTQNEFRKFIEFGQQLGLKKFSLGMTSDWQLAVRAGSTHLRVGTAIFGPRT